MGYFIHYLLDFIYEYLGFKYLIKLFTLRRSGVLYHNAGLVSLVIAIILIVSFICIIFLIYYLMDNVFLFKLSVIEKNKGRFNLTISKFCFVYLLSAPVWTLFCYFLLSMTGFLMKESFSKSLHENVIDYLDFHNTSNPNYNILFAVLFVSLPFAFICALVFLTFGWYLRYGFLGIPFFSSGLPVQPAVNFALNLFIGCLFAIIYHLTLILFYKIIDIVLRTKLVIFHKLLSLYFTHK